MYKNVMYFGYTKLEGRPSDSRLTAFINYFSDKGFLIKQIGMPKKDNIMKLFFSVLKSRGDSYFLISMPPFRGLWLFFIPGLKVILDIRDGWSIAQATGYGGVAMPKPLKARVTRFVERCIIRRAHMTITCTLGLQVYLQDISDTDVLLIPNGVSAEDLELIRKLKREVVIDKDADQLVFCCAGQFSEYGVLKVKELCNVIVKRYGSLPIKLNLIGSDELANGWVCGYLEEISNGRASAEIFPRMKKSDLYISMLGSDYGVAILRDPAYDFGTKVYDYIAVGLPVVNYFNKPNGFTEYFDACLDAPFGKESEIPEISRSKLISCGLDDKGFNT